MIKKLLTGSGNSFNGIRLTRRLMLAWFLTVLFFFLSNGGNFQTAALANGTSLALFALVFAVCALGILALSRFPWFAETENWLTAGALLAYGLLALDKNSDFGFYVGVVSFSLLVILCVCRCAPPKVQTVRQERFLCATAFLAFVIVVGGTTILRFMTYQSPAYDFGIWVQMFYYMKKTLLPLTTLERSRLLSHFAVHFSPIYYLYLPVCALFPYEATLQLLQAVTVAGGLVPLWLLARHFGFGRTGRTLWCGLYALYPAFACGCYYDLHENCFLAPLLLWLFWAAETRRTRAVVLFALLTMLVKEDAAIYVACAGLFIFLDRKNYKTGAGLTAAAVLWFLVLQALMAKYGLGVMSNRYKNYMEGGSGTLFDVIKNFLANPAYAVSQCFALKKMQFLLTMLLPLGFLPLLTRKFPRFILLIPLILVNLASDYTYQYSIFYHYVFGSGVLLFYLALVNCADLKGYARQAFCACALCAGILGLPLFSLSKTGLFRTYQNQKSRFETIDRMIESIPEDASVSASSFYAAHLCNREVLYEYPGYYSHEDLTDYIIIDLRRTTLTEEDEAGFAEGGYVLSDYEEGLYAVYHRNETAD